MKAVLALLMLCGAAQAEVSIAPLKADLGPIYWANDAQLELNLTPVLSYAQLPGDVRIYKTKDGFQGEDFSGHGAVLCTVQYAMLMRAMAQTCRGVVRPDQVRVIDTALDAHIGFIAKNIIPPRPEAAIRRIMADLQSAAYTEYKNPRMCGDKTMMTLFLNYLADVDSGEFERNIKLSLASPRLPVAGSCS